MVSAIPRLRQRVEPCQPRPRWVDVDSVDLDRHYIERDHHGRGDISDVHEFAEQWVREPFDRAQPQWGLALVRGLAGGRAAIVIKVHHAIADGVGFVLMLAAFTDLEPNPERRIEAESVTEPPVDRPAFNPVHRMLFKLRHAARSWVASPIDSTRRTVATLWSAARLVWPSRTPLSPRMTDRSEPSLPRHSDDPVPPVPGRRSRGGRHAQRCLRDGRGRCPRPLPRRLHPQPDAAPARPRPHARRRALGAHRQRGRQRVRAGPRHALGTQRHRLRTTGRDPDTAARAAAGTGALPHQRRRRRRCSSWARSPRNGCSAG